MQVFFLLFIWFCSECFLLGCRKGAQGTGTSEVRGDLGWGLGCWSLLGDLGQEVPAGFPSAQKWEGGRVGGLGRSREETVGAHSRLSPPHLARPPAPLSPGPPPLLPQRSSASRPHLL